MTDSGLMSIGSFARRCGLTASALRFYADAGLLLPSKVDPVSGYRSYREDQLERAILLRRLREIGMPLATAKSVLDAAPDEAAALVDEHIDAVVSYATNARQQVTVIKATLATAPAAMVVPVSGPVLAAAIEQILTATSVDAEFAVLDGVRFEVVAGGLTVTATDRYRLSTRTLMIADPPAATWAATVNGEDLRDCLADLRRTHAARIEATEHGMWMRLPKRGDRHCRLLTGPFPDYRSMLDALPAATTRVVISRALLTHALEERHAESIQLRVNESGVTVLGVRTDTGVPLPAHISGSPLDVWFEMTTLYPALSTAIGADVLLDLRGPEQPVTIRSADHGDLTTLAMPTMPPSRNDRTTQSEDDT